MAVYKFKIIVEDNDDIYREIEIKSGQTFDDFHNAIQEAFAFDKKHAAAFFVSDDYWRKDQEITLRKEDLELEAEEIRQGVAPKKLMAETKIAKYIDSPRQRFMYVFDPEVKWSFCIELMKILPDNPTGQYPSCVRSIGKSPKQYKVKLAPESELTPEAIAANALLESELEESEIYKTIKNDTVGIDEGDLNHLENEEGEDTGDDTESEFGEDDEEMDVEESDGGQGYSDED